VVRGTAQAFGCVGGRHVSMDARLRLVTGSEAIQEPHWWHWISCRSWWKRDHAGGRLG
jgi:hypothetical protein